MKTYKEFLTERKPLNVAQRKKMAKRMARMMKSTTMQNKIARAKQKHATPDKLWKRAQKAAKMLIIKKSMPTVNYASLPSVKKMQIDKTLAKKYMKIPRIAKKLMPKLKKAEAQRMKVAQEKGQV